MLSVDSLLAWLGTPGALLPIMSAHREPALLQLQDALAMAEWALAAAYTARPGSVQNDLEMWVIKARLAIKAYHLAHAI